MCGSPFCQSEIWVTLGTFIVLLLIYFVPTMVAGNKKNSMGVYILNIFLGWTFIGWVIALVWAVTLEKNPS